jgi:predicted MFS family arabinose efflux permease
MSIFTRPAFISAAGTFAAFRHRNYRLWFIGQLISLIGTWMQNVAQGYLLYTLTGSVAYLGYVGFMSGLPSWLLARILHGDVTTNGLLLSVRGIGAVFGGLFIAALASRGNRGKVWTLGSMVMPLAMVAFALSRNLPVSLLCIGLIGFSYVSLETNNSAIVQSAVPDELRGRVTGLYALMYTGGEPLGALAMGLLADRTSEPFTFYVCSVGLMLFSVLMLLIRPGIRAVE